MHEPKEITDPIYKSTICDKILRALPDWFAIEESITDYALQVRDLPFFAVYNGAEVCGFLALKQHSPFAAEIYVMGVVKNYQRLGVGKFLILNCEKYCAKNKIEFLTVKTLDESKASKSYS